MRPVVLLAAVAVAVLSTGCHRAIRLPRGGRAAQPVPFERGVNSRARVFDFELPQVQVDYDKTHSLKVNGLPLGVQKVDTRQTRAFVLKRSGALLADTRCVATQKGTHVKFGGFGRDDSRHELACAAEGFELVVKETGNDIYNGQASRGPVSLRLSSTNDMAEGTRSTLSGFHLYREQRWLGSFEYFPGGNAYLAPDLSPEEREAVVMTMLAVVSTDGWLERTPEQNQPGSPLGFR